MEDKPKSIIMTKKPEESKQKDKKWDYKKMLYKKNLHKIFICR